MLSSIKNSWHSKLTFGIFLTYTIWWIIIQFSNLNPESVVLDYFAGSYCLIAVLGGIWGIQTTIQWGAMKSVMGKAIMMLSFGLLSQAFGQLTYTFYVTVLGVEIPYPSIGDVGYFGSILFYIYGIILLAKASGVRFTLNTIESKIQSVLIPLAILGYSYFLFLKEYEFDWSKPLTIILDFGYPLGQAIYISLALLTYLLTRKILGGIMKNKIIFLLLALLTQYLADFNFLFQNSRDTWTYAGYGDYLYFLAYFIMTFALLKLRAALYEIRRL